MSISTASARRPSTPRVRRRRIGLELGGGRLRFALPRDGTGRFTLGTLSLDAPAGAWDVHALRSRLRRAGLPSGPAVCTLASPTIDIFPLQLQPGEPDVLEAQVVAQAQAQISYPLAGAVLDYAPLPASARRPVSTTVPVLVYAAPLNPITTLLERLEAVGLSVERLLTPASVLAPRVGAVDVGARRLLVATGEEATSVSVVQHGAVLLERILPWGVEALVQRLHVELDLPVEQCRALLEAELPAAPAGSGEDPALDGTLHGILGPIHRAFAGEMRGCLGYCDSFLHNEPVAAVILCGPLQGNRFLREVLERELALPVVQAAQGLDLSGPSPHPEAGIYATAICGALLEEGIAG
jgi:Tfp pilus assembly PilM family ATPase